jgi:serine O-acetyltransferase
MFARLKEDIQCVFERDPAARNAFEVLTTYPGVWAVMIHRLSHALWNYGMKWLARVLSNVPRWMTGIEIHLGARIGRRFFIDHGMGVVIGETAEIGDDCTLYHGVTLGGTSWAKGKRHPTLKDNVVIGAGAKILGPITLHDSARVGSNAVVVKDVPAEATVVGIPGHIVGSKQHKDHEKRHAMAKKLGFDAYGASRDMPDPVANAFHGLIDHIQALDDRLGEVSRVVHDMGGAVSEEKIPDMEMKDLDSLDNSGSET